MKDCCRPGVSRRVLVIEHVPGPRDDRVSARLQVRGHTLEWCCPVAGDELPDPGPGDYRLVVVQGGLQSANDAADDPAIAREIEWIGRWVRRGGRYLGLCLGAQLLARALGARVGPRPDGRHEIGFVRVEPVPGAGDFLAASMYFYQWHREGFDVPRGGHCLARGEHFPNQAFRYGSHAYGLQFHPEIDAVTIGRWCEEAGSMLGAPGAHPRARQARDFARHGEAMLRWLDAFVERLIARQPGCR